VVANGYQLLKIDTLDNSPISDNVLGDLLQTIRDAPADAVVFSDFRHGIFNRRTIPQLIDAIPPGCYRVGDSQVASRWGNILEFRGFDLITPNEREARFALADQDLGVRPLASALYDAAQCKLLILKLGDRGVLACRGGPLESPDRFFVVDSFVDRLVDAVGAGDALLAYATLAMLVTRSQVMATILGSMAAACECEFDGNVPVLPAAMHGKINAVEGLAHEGA
jgi:bifunctional ADP-heptose synthase (sugar kinase/adenylyltransferase)